MKAKNWLIIAAIVVFGALVASIYPVSTALSRYHGDKARIYIPSDADAAALKDTLSRHAGAEFAAKVMRLYRWRGGEPAAAHGSYVIAPGDRAWSIASRLIKGRQTPVRVTFNNLRTLDQLALRMSERLEFTPDSFMAACDSVLPALGYAGREQYPAAFIPDTYEYYWTDPAVKVVRSLAAYRDKFWTPRRRAKAKSLGLTPVQAATVASIVEEETAKADERPKVARLYINRLDRGMKLQADPTVKFAIGDFTLRRIYGDMLKTQSPYNTYANAGLPPGPIRIADGSAIDAVLDAPRHDFIYMCARADFSGYHDFAADYDTHMANARRYRAQLDRRGIK